MERGCLCVVVIVAGVLGNLAFQAAASFRYLDPWVGTQADRAERLDQERTIASGWVVTGCSLVLCGVVVRLRGVAAGFVLAGLFISLLAIEARNQADAELAALVAPHNRWLRDANETMESLGLPVEYESLSTMDSAIGAADEVDRWSVDQRVRGPAGPVRSDVWDEFVSRVAGPLRECNEGIWEFGEAYALPDDRRLIIYSRPEDGPISRLSIVRSEATETWETACHQ